MFETVKANNKRVSDWQIAQIKLAGKQAQTTLANTLNAWESTAALVAASQEQFLAGFDVEGK